ncbi:MAG: YceI family protein [Cyclobacteriaceae bacterium]
MKQITQINKICWVLSLVIFLMAGGQTLAQTTYTLTADQEFKVEGTSTIHDWEMISDKARGEAKIDIKGQKIENIKSLSITLPTNSLKSGKNSMDDNAYEALNARQHPKIQFELTEVESITAQIIKAKGKITIAGTTREVLIDVTYKVSENTIVFTGEFPITFKQFDVDPPKAVFGTITTGNELKISFKTTFKSIN